MLHIICSIWTIYTDHIWTIWYGINVRLTLVGYQLVYWVFEFHDFRWVLYQQACLQQQYLVLSLQLRYVYLSVSSILVYFDQNLLWFGHTFNVLIIWRSYQRSVHGSELVFRGTERPRMKRSERTFLGFNIVIQTFGFFFHSSNCLILSQKYKLKNCVTNLVIGCSDIGDGFMNNRDFFRHFSRQFFSSSQQNKEGHIWAQHLFSNC